MERKYLDNHEKPIWDAGFSAGATEEQKATYDRGWAEGRAQLAEEWHEPGDKPRDERRELIRIAAIELAAVYRMRDPILHMARADGEMAWNAARLLWDTKPEDC